MSSDGRRIRKRIRREGELIGSGAEACVYAMNDKDVWKVFKKCKKEDIERNVQFLIRYRSTDVVPKFRGCYYPEEGLLKMERIVGVTLAELLKPHNRDWLKQIKPSLLLMCWISRLRLPHDVEFCDFKNPKNIMVVFDSNESMMTTRWVYFIEGGNEIPNTPNALWIFMEYIIDIVRGKRLEVAKNIRNFCNNKT
jgi:hypothetical protein